MGYGGAPSWVYRNQIASQTASYDSQMYKLNETEYKKKAGKTKIACPNFTNAHHAFFSFFFNILKRIFWS